MTKIRCQMHNQEWCSICAPRRPTDCDFGTCYRKGTVVIHTPHGEDRAACTKHAKFIPGTRTPIVRNK